ncbi:MAG: pre-16S rRNA-processing nuclease YqgF [Armatimonadetes bacterium]|nr:pre-16S rRNA-processing nuclease YqgF [Armatimonadota bacterium]
MLGKGTCGSAHAQNAALLAIDPGRDKCGLALLKADGTVVLRAIVPRPQVVDAVLRWADQAVRVVVGKGTTARSLVQELRAAGLAVDVVDETSSTLAARQLYWQANPPRGWRRLLPRSLMVPPVPVDDWAAVVVGRRYLANSCRSDQN